MANGRTAHSLDIAVAATDAMPSRSVLPLPLCADDRDEPLLRRDRFRFDGAAALSAVLHGGLVAALIFLLGGGSAAGLPDEEAVTVVALATAAELGDGQPPPAPPQQATPALDIDPLQAALEPAQPIDEVPLRFAESAPAKPKPVAKK